MQRLHWVVVLLGLALLGVSVPSLVDDWKVVSGETDSEFRYFVNTSSIERKGDTVTFWIRNNYVTRGSSGELSAKNRVSINCVRSEWTFRHVSLYDDIDAEGMIVLSRDMPSDWHSISPKTVLSASAKLVCH